MLTRFWVKGVRNLSEQVLTFDKGNPFFIFGDNNQGKTNFLESLYLLGNWSSPVAKTVSNCLSFGGQEAILGADFELDDGSFRVYLKLDDQGRKYCTLNDQSVKRLSSLSSYLAIDFLSADVIRIFKESPDFRRKDLDRFCSRFFTGYLSDLKRYERLIRQKNKLLKEPVVDQQLLGVLNIQLVDLACSVVGGRLKGLEALERMMQPWIADLHSSVSGMFRFRYLFKGFDFENGFDEAVYRESLAQKLVDNRAKELASKSSLYGPHRDDFDCVIGDRSLFLFFSRGVNRSVALLYKLAQLCCMESQFKVFPMLLLDDPFAELDVHMKQQLVLFLKGKAQLVYTTVLESDKDVFDCPNVYRMEKGVLCPK